MIINLQDQVTQAIRAKEKVLLAKYNETNSRLQDREVDIQKLKLLFVEKLRELETSFVEIGHEVAESGNYQQQQA